MRRIIFVGLLVVAIVLLAVPALAQVDTNSVDYWETQLGHGAECFKHEGSNIHGTDNGDGSVTLNVFNQAWVGDHWEALIVKSGSVDVGHGPGNELYLHPTAGVAYFGPLNSGGEQGGVSHWIVCKGTTPNGTTTTSSTSTTTSSSTTIPEETTTSSPSTTVPESSTTTSTTTETTTTDATTTTVGPTTTSPPPPGGVDAGGGSMAPQENVWMLLIAAGLALLSLSAVALRAVLRS